MNDEVPFVRKYFEGGEISKNFVWVEDVDECAAQTEVWSGLGVNVPDVKLPQRVQSRKNIDEFEFLGDYTGQ